MFNILISAYFFKIEAQLCRNTVAPIKETKQKLMRHTVHASKHNEKRTTAICPLEKLQNQI